MKLKWKFVWLMKKMSLKDAKCDEILSFSEWIFKTTWEKLSLKIVIIKNEVLGL